MRNKFLSLILFFSLLFLACPLTQKEPLEQAKDALAAHQDLLEAAKTESLPAQIMQLESRMAKANPFLERDEKELPKELISAQKSLQQAHDAWRSAITKMEKIPKTPDSEKEALQSEISSYIKTAESSVKSAENIIESIKK